MPCRSGTAGIPGGTSACMLFMTCEAAMCRRVCAQFGDLGYSSRLLVLLAACIQLLTGVVA